MEIAPAQISLSPDFAPCSSCVLTDWGSPWQDFHWHLPDPKWTSRAPGVSQKKEIVFEGSWSSWEASRAAGELAGVTARSLQLSEVLDTGKMTEKMQILPGKEGRITPQGMFPFGIWGAKISKAQLGLTQVLPTFPVRSLQWLTGVSNIPLLMEREGKEMSELVTYSYFELLQVHRSIIWKGVCCWEKNSSLFSLCRGLDELQDDWVNLERLVGAGFISRWSRRNSFEISLHECLPNSHCCRLEFWTDKIKDEFKDKICLKIFACWRHPLVMMWREIW